MKNLILIIVVLVNWTQSFGQIIDLYYPKYVALGSDSLNSKKSPLEFFEKGSIDVFSNGYMQGTAQMLKINIGEPNKFYIPVYFLIGSPSDGISNKKNSQDNTVASLLNPIGGIFNASIRGRNSIFQTGEKTLLTVSYQVSAKFITGRDSLNNNNFFGTGYGNIGFLFQTGAWEAEDQKNMGTFWIQVQATASNAFNTTSFKDVFGDSLKDNYFYGYSFDLGVEINKVINLKVGMYQYINNQQIDAIKNPIWKFSLDYRLKKS